MVYTYIHIYICENIRYFKKRNMLRAYIPETRNLDYCLDEGGELGCRGKENKTLPMSSLFLPFICA